MSSQRVASGIGLFLCTIVLTRARRSRFRFFISDTNFTEAYPYEDPRNPELKEIRTKTFGGRQEEALRDSIAWANENVDFLKGILAGHTHITVQDRFSPTAMEYVVGGNFMFLGREITFS
jgi:hypothetical protein